MNLLDESDLDGFAENEIFEHRNKTYQLMLESKSLYERTIQSVLTWRKVEKPCTGHYVEECDQIFNVHAEILNDTSTFLIFLADRVVALDRLLAIRTNSMHETRMHEVIRLKH